MSDWYLSQLARQDQYGDTPPANWPEVYGGLTPDERGLQPQTATIGPAEMRSYQPTLGERIKGGISDLFRSGGADPYNAGKLGDIATTGLSMFPPIGIPVAKSEMEHGVEARSPGGVVMGALGAIPGAKGVLGEIGKPFYSAAGRAVDNAKLGKGTADQWLGYLRNQPGVKPEELQYVFGNLPEGQLTKAQMQAHAAENAVTLGEVVKGDPAEVARMTPDSPSFDPDRIQRANPTKYSEWQLPGGENYRETLLTLPPKGEPVGQRPSSGLPGRSNEQVYSEPTFRSSHWDEPNVLAHVRTNDREIPGVGKSLHVEEIQSDWHQKGRASGYNNAERAAEIDGIKQQLTKLTDEWDTLAATSPRRGTISEEMNVLNDKLRAMNSDSPGVPDAPFKSTWADVALKRQIREASEKGYDAISWTPGEAQAARYDLSKHVKSLHYDQGEGKLVGTDHNGRQVISEYVDATPEAFEPIIGKEPAKKLHDAIKSHEYDRAQWETFKDEETGRWHISDPNGETLHDYGGDPVAYRHRGEANEHIDDMLKEDAMREGSGHPEITGLDLKVGGEGMEGFYDKMLVDKANALAKKHGARVEQSEIKTSGGKPTDYADYDAWQASKNQPVHVLRITPELRAAAMKGFPLFTAGGLVAGGTISELARQDKYGRNE